MNSVLQTRYGMQPFIGALALAYLVGVAAALANDPPPEVVPLSNVLEPVELHLKASAPSAQYPGPGQDNRIHPRGTQEVRIEVDKSGIAEGSNWQLQGGVVVETSVDNGDHTLWTIGDQEHSADSIKQTLTITNTAPERAHAVAVISCVWRRVGAGGAGSGGTIPGEGIYEAWLEDSVVVWEFTCDLTAYSTSNTSPEAWEIGFDVVFYDTACRALTASQISNITYTSVGDPGPPSVFRRFLYALNEALSSITNRESGDMAPEDLDEGASATPVVEYNDGSQGEAAAPVVISQLRTEIIDAENEATETLEIAKMEDSLKADGSLIIDDDEDRFYVKVFNAGEFANATVTMATVDNPDEAYNNPEVGITLDEDDGHLITESMMLVADEVDDEYPGLNDEVGANNENDDRSHLIQLEGSVLVSELAIADQSAELELRAEVEVEDTVHLNVIVFDVSNQTVAGITSEVEGRVKERFAQIGIKVILETEIVEEEWDQEWGPPNEFSINNFNETTEELELSQSVVDMIESLGSEQQNTINVFVVKRCRIVNQHGGGFQVGGYAFIRSHPWNYLPEEYRTSVFVSGDFASHWTLAHEVGHMTTNKSHYAEDYDLPPNNEPEPHQILHNLMVFDAADLTDIQGTKRLYRVQMGNSHAQP